MNSTNAATRGPGRPSTGVRVDIRIPADLLADVDAFADGWAVSRAHMLRTLVKLGLTTWKKSGRTPVTDPVPR